jgi:hypothetical protein
MLVQRSLSCPWASPKPAMVAAEGIVGSPNVAGQIAELVLPWVDLSCWINLYNLSSQVNLSELWKCNHYIYIIIYIYHYAIRPLDTFSVHWKFQAISRPFQGRCQTWNHSRTLRDHVIDEILTLPLLMFTGWPWQMCICLGVFGSLSIYFSQVNLMSKISHIGLQQSWSM